MSKAFTRESDDSSAEDTPPPRRQLPPGTKNLITRQGADHLRQQMETLLQKRDGLATTGVEAGSETQAQRRKVEHAIGNLQHILSSIVIAEAPVDRAKVGFGAAVRIKDEDGREETFRIVGFDEADPDRGAISWLSPLAKALLSKRAGETVLFRERELTILSVSY